jgi:O-antigen/teichoic acid export membrane protein
VIQDPKAGFGRRLSTRIQNLLGRSETLRVSGTATVLIAIRLLGTLGTFAYTVLMARMMSPQDFGLIWTLLSAVYLCSYLTTLNIGSVAIREIVKARAAGDDATATGFVVISRRILLVVTVPAMMGFVGVIWWRNPEVLADHWLAVLIAAVMIPVMGWNMTNSQQATALGQSVRSQLPRELIRPLVFLVALGSIWVVGVTLNLEEIIALYLLVVVLVAVFQYVLIARFFGFTKGQTPHILGWQRWILSGLMLAPTRLVADQLKSVLIMAASLSLGSAGVAKIAIALNIVNFMNFAITAVELAFSAKTSQSLLAGIKAGVPGPQMFRATHFIAISGVLKLGLVTAGMLVFWLIMPQLIGLFGPGYGESLGAAYWFLLIPASKAFFGNTILIEQIFDHRLEIMISSLLGVAALPLAATFVVPVLVRNGADPVTATAMVFALVLTGLQALRWAICLWRTKIDASVPGALWRRAQQRSKANQ